MFNRIVILISSFTLHLAVALPANAAIVLFDWSFNIDGALYDSSGAMPTSGALDSSGLGSVTYDFVAAGSHNITAFYDFEIDEPINTFFNEYGDAAGSVATGQSWEIDEPGWAFGDIYDNMLAGSLDNSNSLPSGSEDDVSFALGWDFTLDASESATVTFNLTSILPIVAPDFYLTHADADSPDTIYFWSELVITGVTPPYPTIPVSAPGTLVLCGIGLLGFGLVRKRRTYI